MENKFLNFFRFEGIFDTLKGYVDAKIQLIKLDIQEKASNIIATIFFMLMLLFSFLMTLVFSSLALGHYLNTIFHSEFMGFAALALFYLLLMMIMAFNVKKGFLHKVVKNLMMSIMASKKK